MKILIIGSGNVGAHVGYLSLFSSYIDEVLIYDIQKDLTLGKVLDLNHAAGVLKKNIKFTALESLNSAIADVVIITAGMPRREGMSRFDLLEVNVDIMQDIIEELNEEVLKKAIFIIVANPVDVLTYYFYKKSKVERKRIIGMAGALDSGRLRYYLHEKINNPISKIEPYVIGAHSKEMVCLYDKGDRALIERAKDETKNAGAQIISYYKGSSAYFAPAAGVKIMLDAIFENKSDIIASVAVLEAEYGFSDIAFGVPLRINKTGIKNIIELKLTESEKAQLAGSIKGIQDAISYLKEKSLI